MPTEAPVNLSAIKIKFVREERDCQLNRDRRADGSNRGIIYDYAVMIDGERRGTFEPGIYRGYTYNDQLGETVRDKSKGNFSKERYYGTKKKADFGRVINLMLSIGLIPTAADIEARKAESAAKEKRAADQRREQIRLSTIRDAAPDLLAALGAITAAYQGSLMGFGYTIADTEEDQHVAAALAAIRKAETVDDDAEG